MMSKPLACLLLFIGPFSSGFHAERPSRQRAILGPRNNSGPAIERLKLKHWLQSSPAGTVSRQHAAHPHGSSTTLLFSKNGDRRLIDPNDDGSSYSDDCFGLIFLTGLAVVRDQLFAATFLVLSVVAVLLARFDKLPKSKPLSLKRGVPAVVAGTSFVMSTALHGLVVNDLSPLLEAGTTESPLPISPVLTELVVCSISVLYAIVENRAATE